MSVRKINFSNILTCPQGEGSTNDLKEGMEIIFNVYIIAY